MIKLTLIECVKQGISPENVVPTDIELWTKSLKIYSESHEKAKLIAVYESLGGRFKEKIVETKSVTQDDDLDEDFEFSPLSGSKSARRRMKHLKSRDPYTVERMTGWN